MIFKLLLNFAASFAKASCIFGMSKDEERTERESVCRSVIYAKRNEDAAIFCQHLQALEKDQRLIIPTAWNDAGIIQKKRDVHIHIPFLLVVLL
ncbi:MAG: hypothetical protein OIF56_03575 [Cohaesibacter sp.]|nr:hypothetical protein [Cohaesibacter sp.]